MIKFEKGLRKFKKNDVVYFLHDRKIYLGIVKYYEGYDTFSVEATLYSKEKDMRYSFLGSDLYLDIEELKLKMKNKTERTIEEELLETINKICTKIDVSEIEIVKKLATPLIYDKDKEKVYNLEFRLHNSKIQYSYYDNSWIDLCDVTIPKQIELEKRLIEDRKKGKYKRSIYTRDDFDKDDLVTEYSDNWEELLKFDIDVVIYESEIINKDWNYDNGLDINEFKEAHLGLFGNYVFKYVFNYGEFSYCNGEIINCYITIDNKTTIYCGCFETRTKSKFRDDEVIATKLKALKKIVGEFWYEKITNYLEKNI